MSNLVTLASAYRDAKAANKAAFDDLEMAQAAVEAATARWEAAGSSASAAQRALLEHAASGDTLPKGQDAKQGLAGTEGSAVGATSAETPKA